MKFDLPWPLGGCIHWPDASPDLPKHPPAAPAAVLHLPGSICQKFLSYLTVGRIGQGCTQPAKMGNSPDITGLDQAPGYRKLLIPSVNFIQSLTKPGRPRQAAPG